MKPILNIYDFLPVLLLLVQTLILLTGITAVLRFLKIVQLPYAGMEYSKLIIASMALLSMMLISFADVEAMIQTVKAFHSYGDDFYKNVFVKFCQFVLVIVVTQCFWGVLCFITLRVIPGFRQSSNAGDDIPGAIFKAVIMFIINILLYTCAKEIIGSITPKYISFT